MYQNTERYNIPYPELSSQSENLKISFEEQKHLENLIENQYIYQKGLGIDYSNNVLLNKVIYENIILYVNENLIPIVQYETILENDKNCQLFGQIIYKFLVVDLLKDILPKIVTYRNVKTCQDLKFLDIDEWKYHLSLAVSDRVKTLNMIRQTSDNNQIALDHFKYTYYLDLIDNDITGLIERFIIPMINSYFVEIDSTIL